MWTITVPDKIISKAQGLADSMGSIKNSITSGEGNLAGFIGELMAVELFNARHESCKDYDIVLPNGKRIDVKTKRTTREPLPYYDNSVAETSLHQNCDGYIFMRYKEDTKTLYVLGSISKRAYFRKARFLKQGSMDGDNGFIVKANCYNLPVSDLLEIPYAKYL